MNSTDRFFTLLNLCKMQNVRKIWDRSTSVMVPKNLDFVKAYGSTGERVMASFFCGVWCGYNRENFNLIEDLHKLDENNQAIIALYCSHPFHP